MAGWRKNEPTAAFRRAAVYIFEDDGVTPAPLATSFTVGAAGNTQIRKGGTTWVDAGGTLTNTGIDGHWLYEATQAETNFDGTEFEIKVEKAGFSRATSIVQMNTANLIWDALTANYVLTSSFGKAVGDLSIGSTPPTAAAIADAVWDEARASHVTAGTFGAGVIVDSMVTDSVSAAAVSAAAVTKIQTGLATAANLATAQTTLNTINTKLGTPAVDLSVDIAAIMTRLGAPAGASMSADIAAIKVDTADTRTKVTSNQTDIGILKKIAIGRWKIQGTQLILYELDGSTVYKTFNLLDDVGAPSNVRIFERVPV